MKFMAMLVRPDRQATFADILGYTPTVRKAMPLVSAAARKWMPSMTSPGTVVMDDNMVAVELRAVAEAVQTSGCWRLSVDDVSARLPSDALLMMLRCSPPPRPVGSPGDGMTNRLTCPSAFSVRH